MRLIVTRPEPDAGRTAQALAALGHEPILSPVLDISPDPDADLGSAAYQGVLVTSSNAVRALALNQWRQAIVGLPLLAVGDRTALEAKRAGFESARSAGGALDDLVALAATQFDPGAGPLLYAAGDVRSDELGGRLGALGFRVATVIVYRARPRPRLAAAAADALRGAAAAGVLLYSRRSAEAFARAVQAEGLAPLPERISCYCLSGAVAAPLPAVATGPIRIAERPDQISLFALLERAEPSRA